MLSLGALFEADASKEAAMISCVFECLDNSKLEARKSTVHAKISGRDAVN
jgi:hypothetical protein